MAEGPARGIAGFAERLLEVIDTGRRTATYKLALILSLIDLCTTRSDAFGRAPKVLHTRDVAEQVASLYWRQVAPFRVPLRQMTTEGPKIVRAVSEFRALAASHGATSLHLARQVLPDEYGQMLDRVEATAAEQPIPRLQTVGSSTEVFPFIYEIDWADREHFTVAHLRGFGERGPELRMCGPGSPVRSARPRRAPAIPPDRTAQPRPARG